jgi:hypothetical protein
MNPTESYLKVPYDLRPAKQVERRMLLDAFQRLSRCGFQLGDYQYTGFGSVYFVDFVMFHRLLGLEKLLSVEYSKKVEKRVRFNKPFDLIKIQIDPISNVIPTLSRDSKHILWLDYDDTLRAGHLADTVLAANQLSAGSILLVTVDVEPPADDGGPQEWFTYFNEEAERFLNVRWTHKDFVRSQLVSRNVEILEKAINNGLSGREGIRFLPLFNFLYADGHQMLTVGGVIGGDTEARQLASCDFRTATYIRQTLSAPPYVIRVPRITRKERLYLDSAMPSADDWVPQDFELSLDDVLAYREIYRYYPAYAEMLL